MANTPNRRSHTWFILVSFMSVLPWCPPTLHAQCQGVIATDRFAIPPYAMWHVAQLTDFPAYLEVYVDPACGPVNYTTSFQVWHEGGDTLISIPDLEAVSSPFYCAA